MKKITLGLSIALTALLVLAFVQFSGTFITCHLLYQTREETAEARQQAEAALQEGRALQSKFQQAAMDARARTMLLEVYEMLQEQKLASLKEDVAEARKKERERLAEILKRLEKLSRPGD